MLAIRARVLRRRSSCYSVRCSGSMGRRLTSTLRWRALCLRCSVFWRSGTRPEDERLLPLIGLLAGFAYTTKLTAFVAIPYACVFVLYRVASIGGRSFVRPMLIVCGCTVLMVDAMVDQECRHGRQSFFAVCQSIISQPEYSNLV